MSEVYLAEHVHIGRLEALEVLRPELARDERFVSRFRREARATNRIQHATIIGIDDFGVLGDGRLYLSMEYADGPPLEELLRDRGAPPVARGLHVLRQLAAAIDAAHVGGVMQAISSRPT